MQYVHQVESAIKEMTNIFEDPDVIKIRNKGRKSGRITASQAAFLGKQYHLLFPTARWNGWWNGLDKGQCS